MKLHTFARTHLGYGLVLFHVFLFAATASGQLTVNPSSVAFGSVPIATSASQSVVLSNTGNWELTIFRATVPETGFSISGITLPLTLAPGQSANLTTTFAPFFKGPESGNVVLEYSRAQRERMPSGTRATVFLSGTGTSPSQLTANPGSLNFGNVQVGSSQTSSVNLTNSGNSSVTISQATLTGASFTLSGLALPLTLGAGQSTTFSVRFAPQSAGNSTGSVSITSTASDSNLSIPLSGNGVTQGMLTANPTSLAFGSVQVGSSASLAETLTNTGGSSLTISAAAISGPGFSLSGLALPLTLTAGQSTPFTVLFSPASSGTANGSVTITSNGSNSNLSIPLSGTGVTAGTLTANPPSLAFGNVQVGNSASLSETLTNTGGSSLTISAAAISGPGFSVSGLALPLTLTAGQSTSFTVLFSPASSGTANGSVTIASNGSNSNLSIPLSGTGVTQGTLTANPPSLAFGNVQVGNSASLSETLTNTGGSTLSISQVSLSSASFSVSGLNEFPITLTPNQSVTFTAIFTPTSPGAVSGTLAVVSNAFDSPLNIALSGTGTAAGTLAVSPTSLNFGNVTVGSSASLNGTLTASGASVTVQPASDSNSEFVLSGISLPVTISAGQSATFKVTFTPQSSGATSGTLSFPSNASNSPAVQTVTGTGVAQNQHTVDLSWNASADAVGYNIFRGTVPGGPYAMINSSLDDATSYIDSTVVSGNTYYYVTTAVNSESQQSGYSNQATAVIPNP